MNMFSYFAKGFTVGRTVSGRVLRMVTGLPGLALDAVFALFMLPDYTSYWNKDSSTITFPNGDKTTSVMYGMFGYIGELTSYVIAPVFGLVGAALYIPDLLLRGLIFSHNKIRETFSDFAYLIGNTSSLQNFFAERNPHSFMGKVWNIGVFGGIVAGFIPYMAAKAIDFIFPLGLSSIVKGSFALAGGIAGSVIGIFLALPLYLIRRAFDFLELVRDSAEDAVASVYAWGNVSLRTDSAECCEPQALHTSTFIDKVEQKRSSNYRMWNMFFGGTEDTGYVTAAQTSQPAQRHQNASAYPSVSPSTHASAPQVSLYYEEAHPPHSDNQHHSMYPSIPSSTHASAPQVPSYYEEAHSHSHQTTNNPPTSIYPSVPPLYATTAPQMAPNLRHSFLNGGYTTPSAPVMDDQFFHTRPNPYSSHN